jgi:hypothetical protein
MKGGTRGRLIPWRKACYAIIAGVDIGDVLTAIGGIAGGTAALYVAIRAKSIEDYRHALQREGVEHEVRFRRLHERRVEVISDVYRNLVRAERAMGSWTRPLQMAGEPSSEEKGKDAVEAAAAFVQHFEENRIWLEADLCEDVKKVADGLYRAYVDFTTYRRDDFSNERLEMWQKAWRAVSEDVPGTRERIEGRVRAMLGVTPTAT